MTSKCENSKTTKENSKTPNTIEDVFPCLSEFNKIIHSLTGSRNYQHLEEALLLYTQHIRSSISSNVKFGNCKFSVIYSNLKNHVNNMLIYFHLYWFDIKQDITDHTSYLNKMSTLLNIYINMELKTSNHVKDPSEMAARIFAALYIYLNNSEEHIFKVLLRIKNMEKYTKICNHVFMKSFTNLKTKITSITDIAYVRYLLAFKIWKKMEENSDKKKKINELAIMILGSRMPELRHELKFVPQPPKNEKNETSWLLHANLKNTLHHFLLFEDKMDNFKDLQRTKMKHQINSLYRWSGPKQEISKDHINDSKSHNISSIDRNSLKKNKKKTEQMKHKQNKIIIIDITGDAEISKVKRKKAKLGYLRIMEENVKKNKKHINHLKFSSELIATNKTNYNKSSKNSVKNTCFEYKPISENNISDSTKNYTLNSQENKFPVERNKSIKIDPETESSLMNITEMKYGKKGSLSADVLPATSQIYQDTNVANINKLTDERKSKSILTCRQNIKQEFNNPIASNCGIQGCSLIHSHSHEVIDQQHSLHIPVTHLTTISSIYGNCAAGTNLYVPYHEHCSVSCSLQINSTTSLHSHKKSANSCGRSHCSCLNRTYDIVTHCRQCIHPATDSHVSCIESNSYFLPAHPNTCLDKSNDTCTVSTACNEDQIVESTLYSQHFDGVNDYGNVAKYSGTTMEEQESNNCDCEQGRSDISMSNNLSHSSELYAFDIDSFEMDSNEDSEIMKSDSIDDLENIGFLHNEIQIETLENVLSNDTVDSLLPLKQSPYELDTIYTDTLSNKKDILCNNQNDTIDSNVAFCLNNGNTFLRLPAKSDKPIVNRKKFHVTMSSFC